MHLVHACVAIKQQPTSACIMVFLLVEDKHELQDVDSPVEKLSVESHSQWEEPAVEQQGSSHCTIHYSVATGNHGILAIHIDQLPEKGEPDHQVEPVLTTGLGNYIKVTK